MYGRQPPISRAFSPPGAPPVGSVVHTLNMALAMRREGRSMRTTIYGRFDYDLAGSIGPVPVTFSLEPQMNVPANRPVATNIGRGSSSRPHHMLVNVRRSARGCANYDYIYVEVILRIRYSNDRYTLPEGAKASIHVLFFGFALIFCTAVTTALCLYKFPLVGHNEAIKVGHGHDDSTFVSALSIINSIAFSNSGAGCTCTFSSLTVTKYRRRSAASYSDGAQVLRTLSLGQPSSQFSHQNGPTLARPPLPRLTPTAAVSPVANMSLSPPSSPLSPKSIATSFPSLRHSQSAILTSPKSAIRSPSPRLRVSSQCHRSGETEASHRSSIASQNSPKRSKFSMPPLRLVNSNQSSLYSIRSPTLSLSPSDTPDQKTVQVQDMDFELVKPTIPQSPLAFNSVDSLSQTLNSAALPDNLLRTDSPALSTLSGSSLQVEAHRQRELRWISVMSSVPASHARKSKKVKKMVLEGVPSSVRYLVWAHLADSKAKRMDGLYQRLCKREKVAASADIERDVQQSFVEQPQLQDGSLVNLLQAYLTMVPDIQYNRGLAMIASQLLLQSPEEDAFWTFISLMDSHLRPYFSNSIQLEVDASLFGKALEANDAAAAKKTFSDMAISPNTFCRAWFTTVFADALPSEHLKRVWDVFLFEGITFLFRVGIAIFSCCRRLLLQCTSRDALLELICRPPASCLPQNPEAFLELAFSVKLKDDDLRKQRNKMEAQVKRRTQPRTAPGVNVPSISLPKN
ncbi:TBC1 domain family member 10B [Grifola frondosa]|uniref:TBC1 domain family member 10B n=1 Tax=Grifola frondosa TaxID=5627 RepID=A0A1C7MUI7_GRIFR|nr:TBC1 domain family member 10B [Grifola frondosa]